MELVMTIRNCLAMSVFWLFASLSAHAECLKTSNHDDLVIDPKALADLNQIHLDAQFIWESLVATSIPETSGCWASPTGNSDNQLLSVGVQQWNFGQNSIQRLLKAFKSKDGPSINLVRQYMPKYGGQFFSDGCLRDSGNVVIRTPSETKISASCYNFLTSQQGSGTGSLKPDFAAEVQALFESPVMRQIQLDEFVRNISVHKHDLMTYFGEQPTPLQIKWTIDITTQQGGLPPLTDVQRARNKFNALTESEKQNDVASTAYWYEGVCQFSDTEGVGSAHGDCKYNIPRYMSFAQAGTWKSRPEAADLLMLTRIKSRTAQTKSGVYQAICFERRAQIALGCGMVTGLAIPCDFFASDKGKAQIATQRKAQLAARK
jgi:hypothetical protein